MHVINKLKRNSPIYVLLGIFQNIGAAISKHSHQIIRDRVLEFWTVDYSCIKKWLHQRQFHEIFEDEIIPTEKSVMDSYSGSNLQCF